VYFGGLDMAAMDRSVETAKYIHSSVTITQPYFEIVATRLGRVYLWYIMREPEKSNGMLSDRALVTTGVK
jgi:hypothetical protein